MNSKLAIVNFPHSLRATGFGEKEYNYKTYIKGLTPGNLVVVETQTGYTVARFKKYVDESKVDNLKYIVQQVDIDEHLRLREQCEEEDLLS